MRWSVSPRSRFHRGALALGLRVLAGVIALPMVGAAQSGPAPAAQTEPAPARPLSLPAVPRFQLSPPGAAGASREGPPWSSYWRYGKVPEAWRFSTDADLRLEVPMVVLDLGSFSLSQQLETVPGRERDCLPDCRGPQWSTSLRLKYDAGELGPLRQAGPELELKGARPPGRGQSRGYFGAGFGGKF